MKHSNINKLLKKAAHQRDRLIHQSKNKDSSNVLPQEAAEIVCEQKEVSPKKLVLRETYFTYSTARKVKEEVRDIDSKLLLKTEQRIEIDFSKKEKITLVDQSKSSKGPTNRIISPVDGSKSKSGARRSQRIKILSKHGRLLPRDSSHKPLIIREFHSIVQEQQSKDQLTDEAKNYDLGQAERFLQSQMALFQSFRGQLLENYLNKYVWFENGVVLDVGDTHEEVAMRAYKKHGMKPIFIKKVEKDNVAFQTPTSFNR